MSEQCENHCTHWQHGLDVCCECDKIVHIEQYLIDAVYEKSDKHKLRVWCEVEKDFVWTPHWLRRIVRSLDRPCQGPHREVIFGAVVSNGDQDEG